MKFIKLIAVQISEAETERFIGGTWNSMHPPSIYGRYLKGTLNSRGKKGKGSLMSDFRATEIVKTTIYIK